MEDVKIIAFVSVGSGYGSDSDYGFGDGCGFGYGSGSGYGDGKGYGRGLGSGSGHGSGHGSGYGCGDGHGHGSGYGCGDGHGHGFGDGSGYGSDFGDGIKTINGKTVYMIDNVQTVIERVSHGVAKGFIVNGDLTLSPCWVVKQNDVFAHGKTLREAREALMNKLFEDMPEEERIAEFVKTHENGKKYSDKDFFEWHNRLTGSCEMGRMAFAKERGLEALDGQRTVQEFIALCENAYGGSTIKKLWEFYPKGETT